MLGPVESWRLLRDAFAAWREDYASSMGAALAYYTLFSIAPLLLIVISVAGLVFGADVARREILAQLSGLLGADSAAALGGALDHMHRSDEGLWGTLIGIAVLVIGATTVFGELQDAIDRIWRVPTVSSAGGLWPLLRSRLLSMSMVLGIGFLLIVSLVVSAALAGFSKWWSPRLADWFPLAWGLDMLVNFGLLTSLFAMIYRWMPKVRIAWRDVWTGAALTALLFALGKSLIGLYIGRSAASSAFGAGASLVVLLLWVYYSAQIFLLGAELTWVYAHRHGSLRAAAAPPPPLVPPAPRRA